MADMKYVKKYLGQLWNIDSEINSKLKAVESMRQTTMSVKATQLKEINVQESNQYTQEDRIGKYLDMETEINNMVDGLVELKVDIIKQINKMNDRLHIIVLTERYVNNKDWEEIADTLNKKPRQIYRYHGSGLQEFYEVNANEINKFIEKDRK